MKLLYLTTLSITLFTSVTSDSFADSDSPYIFRYPRNVIQGDLHAPFVSDREIYAGEAFNYPLSISGGSGPYTWTLTGSPLPDGLSYSSSGVISGTPLISSVGTWNGLSFSASDNSGQTVGVGPFTYTVLEPVALSPALNDAYVGEGISFSLSASGGRTPYYYSVASGSLPAGMGLSGGAVSGTPSSAGSYNATIEVEDANGRTAQAPFDVYVMDRLVPSSSLVDGYVGETYSEAINVSGGVSPYSFGLVPGDTIPSGLSLDLSTGAITGTPASPIVGHTFRTIVSDSGHTIQAENVTSTISVYDLPEITHGDREDMIVGVPYNILLQATGGKPGLTWSATGGLPAGMSLSSSGILSGTPAANAVSLPLVSVSDANGREASKLINIHAYDVLSMTAPSSIEVYTNEAVGDVLSFAGGKAPIAWSVNQLPAGIVMSSLGVLSGTPTTPGTTNSQFTVSDALGQVDNATTAFSIYAPVSVAANPATTDNGIVGAPYSHTFTSTGGKAPISWTTASGTLPAGLSLSSAGVLSGTPSAVGSSSFDVAATDVNGRTDQTSISMDVIASIAISNAPSADGYIGSPYSFQFARTGGQSPFTWSRVSGSLPSGMSLSASGTLSGTPTSSGASSFDVRVTGSGGTHDQASVSMNVYAMPAITNAPTADPYVGSAYSFQFNRSGGKAPFTWSRVSGSLPSGMSLSSSGSLSGTPTAAGNASFVLRVTDANGKFADRSVNLTTLGAVAVANAPSAQGYVGAPYSFQFSPSGGQAPYTWARVSGSLPAGMGLSSSGLLSGTPTSLGTSTFSVRVTDGNGTTATRSVSVNASEYQVSMSSGSSQISLQSLFTSAQWSSPAQKRVVVPNGVVRGNGSTNAAVIAGSGAWGGNLILQINSGAEIQGRGGSANGGTGGNAIYANRRGNANQRLMIVNNGAIRAGGGGGGKGGVGGKGGGGQSGSSDPERLEPCASVEYCAPGYTANYWYESPMLTPPEIAWNGVLIGYAAAHGSTSMSAGGCTYTKGTMYHWWDMLGHYYGVIRTCMTTTEGGNGGAAGNGGRGQGYNMSRHSGSNGSGGAYGGTNAGRGGTGGKGGTGGTWGSSGATGSKGATGQNGNRTNGLAGANGSGGGLAGYAIRSSGNATYSGSGVKQGR